MLYHLHHESMNFDLRNESDLPYCKDLLLHEKMLYVIAFLFQNGTFCDE